MRGSWLDSDVEMVEVASTSSETKLVGWQSKVSQPSTFFQIPGVQGQCRFLISTPQTTKFPFHFDHSPIHRKVQSSSNRVVSEWESYLQESCMHDCWYGFAPTVGALSQIKTIPHKRLVHAGFMLGSTGFVCLCGWMHPTPPSICSSYSSPCEKKRDLYVVLCRTRFPLILQCSMDPTNRQYGTMVEMAFHLRFIVPNHDSTCEKWRWQFPIIGDKIMVVYLPY